jgi:hypothetical protein
MSVPKNVVIVGDPYDVPDLQRAIRRRADGKAAARSIADLIYRAYGVSPCRGRDPRPDAFEDADR